MNRLSAPGHRYHYCSFARPDTTIARRIGSKLTLLVSALAVVAVGCNSQAAPETLGRVCSNYATAVENLTPPGAPIPSEFTSRLRAESYEACIQKALQLGLINSTALDATEVSLNTTEAVELLHDLTAGTVLHVAP